MRLSITFVIALSLAAGRVAHAQPEDEQRMAEAREAHRQALAYYANEQYAEAITAFTKAYELSLASGILFNIAQAYRLLGDCPNAVKTYKRFIADDPGHPNRKLAEESLTSLGECGATKPAGGTTPPPPSTQADPAGMDPMGDGSGAGVPPLAPIDPPAPGRTETIAGIAGFAMGGALLLGSGVFALNASNAADDLEEYFEGGPKPFDQMAAQLEDNYRSDRTKAIVFAALGVAAGGGGAYLFYRGRKAAKEAEASSSVTVAPAGGGAVLLWSGSFE